MHRTIDVIIHEDGTIEPLEPVGVTGSRRALLTILDDALAEAMSSPAGASATAELIQAWQAEGLLEVPADIPSDRVPLSAEERAALAQRVATGKPLSQIIIEDREERF